MWNPSRNLPSSGDGNGGEGWELELELEARTEREREDIFWTGTQQRVEFQG